MFKRDYLKKPDWLKIKIPSGSKFKEVYDLLKKYNLSTVCQEARCPNMYECWSKKSATIMILGKVCTRTCRFCAVETGNPQGQIDFEEPEHVAEVIKILGLKYVVITSVDRDDLEDFGSSHYAQTIKSIKEKNPGTKVEALIPDFSAEEKYLKKVVDAQPFVIGHNVETVKELTPYIRDRRCGYEKSLGVLRIIKKINSNIYTKSGFMIGLGEEKEEIVETLKDLKNVEIDVVTIGQYLQPTKKHHFVQKYYTPEEFDEFKKIGKDIGIQHILSGPLVRSSYRASEVL
ncbi:Lipoyl synthase [subsurface metagenome]|jgi:lipoic acid synthetase